MGWLKKKFRQLDKRIRKIFGKNAWLKVAAIIAGTFIGMGGRGGTPISGKPWFSKSLPPTHGVPAGHVVKGKFATFGTNLGNGIKNMFWNPGTPAKTTAGTPSVTTATGTIPGTPASTTAATKGSLTWGGQAVANLGLNVASGYGQAKLMEGDPVGQYVSAGSNEPSTIDIVQNAYNNRAGRRINILEVYNDLDYGTASTQMADNFLQPAERGFINIPS